MSRPVDARHRVTLGYRQRPSNPRLRGYKHRGIDYGCPKGTPVMSTTGGVVIYAADARPRGGGYGPAFGIHIVVKTADTWHLYGHLSALKVKVGQQVADGQVIGLSGATGNVTGEHLHYAEFTQGPAAWQSDRAPRFIDAGAPAAAPTVDAPTVFDISFWGQAYAPWFGRAWAPRGAGIISEIRGDEHGTEASIHVFTEIFTQEQIDTIVEALGPDFTRANRADAKGGPNGKEVFYNHTLWAADGSPTGPRSGIARRAAFFVPLRRIRTGDRMVVCVAHAPIAQEGGASAKTAYGRWFAGRVKSFTQAKAVVGDFNTKYQFRSPHKELRALGFKNFKEQAKIANEGRVEFPSKGVDYSTIYTIPSEIRLTGGEVDNTSLELSDHLRIEARGVMA